MGQRRRRREKKKEGKKERENHENETAGTKKQSHTVMHEAMDHSIAGWWTEGLARVTTSVT